MQCRRLDIRVSVTFLLVSKGLIVNSKSRKRLLKVTAGGTEFAIMAAPPEDAQISAAPDSQALQELISAQAQASAEPVDLNYVFSSFFIRLL